MVFNQKKFQFIFNLRAAGVTDSKVLTAMESVLRGHFIGQTFQPHALEDIALPIECGQTITQPSIIGIMSQALNVTSRSKILEIGTGSGYQTAILAQLGRRVYTLERYQKLAITAKLLIEELSIANVTILCKDGTLGLAEQAPFDRIIVSAAMEDIPQVLLNQLKPNGVLVAPVGQSENIQTIVKVEKTENSYYFNELKEVRFLPIKERKGTLKINSSNNS